MDSSFIDNLNKFRQTLGLSGITSQPTETVIQPQQIIQSSDADFQKKLLHISSLKVDKPAEGGEDFKGFRNIKSRLIQKHDWDDLEPGEKAYCHLKLINWSDEAEVSNLLNVARTTFNSLLTSFSSKAAYHIMCIAINLRDLNNQELFAPQDPGLMKLGSEVLETQLSKVELFSGSANEVQEIGDKYPDSLIEKQQLLTSYSFVAASLLRVVTKSAENYTKIWGHLKQNFKNFYKYDIRIAGFDPTVPALTALKGSFTSTDVMKHTLYSLIHSSEVCETGGEIKMFLFQIHLQFTGLHSFVLFLKCADAFKVEPIRVAEAFNTPVFSETLQSLSMFFEKFMQEHEGRPKPKMWKYARIFNQHFYAELSTKHTVKFVAVLAYLIKAETPAGTEGDVLQIARVSQLPVEAKQRAQLHSVIIRKLLMTGGYVGPHAALIEV